MPEDIKNKVKAFIVKNFLFKDDYSDLDDAESLTMTGIVDSTGALELVTWIQDEFHFHVEDTEIHPSNLDTVNAIVNYIGKKSCNHSLDDGRCMKCDYDVEYTAL